jgi:plastocyanin
VFTIDEGNGFIRADPFTPTTTHSPIGEWHMHCHVLMHMDQGMMGSLLIINAGGGVALPLPKGRPCPMAMPSGGGGTGGGAPMTATVKDTSSCQWRDDVSGTPETTIKVGGTVTWTDTGSCGGGHTVTSANVAPFGTLTPPMNLTLGGTSQAHTFPTAGAYGYHCNVHGGNPVNKSGMWRIVHVVP